MPLPLRDQFAQYKLFSCNIINVLIVSLLNFVFRLNTRFYSPIAQLYCVDDKHFLIFSSALMIRIYPETQID